MFDYDYLLKYQFSEECKKYFLSKNINLEDVSISVLEKTEQLFTKLYDVENYSRFFLIEELKIKDKKINLDDELFLYPLSRLILNLLDNVPLRQAYANYFQKQFVYFFNKDYLAKDFNTIEKIIKDLSPDISQNQKGFFIPLVSFLSLDLGDDYKLSYSNLESGNVYFLTKDSLIEFLAIILKKRILRTTEINKKEIPKNILALSEKIREKHVSYQKQNVVLVKPKAGELPPCFEKLYTDLLSGNRLSHIANYHLAVFLFNVGYSFEEVLELYKNLPNFDEKIASYQIKNIFVKKYSVANCETLKSNGLCVSDCKVKHPLQLLKKEEQ